VKAIGMIIGSQRRTQTGVTVGTQLAGELPRVRCDRVQLQQVMLIVNAMQSMSSVEDRKRELQSAP
jgi:C4-dicarboxylate-specific signal transduction histidine kinase